MASSPSFSQRVRAALGRGLSRSGPFLARAGGVALLVLLGAWGLRLLWQRATSLERFRVCPAMVQVPLPPWAKPELAEEIRSQPELQKVYSIFEWDLPQTIAHSYLSIPWIRQVHSIRREFPNRIHIQFTLRKPDAVVKIGNRYEMVDEEGVVLPRRLYHWPSKEMEYPFIECPALASIPPAGTKWDNVGVQVGLDLLHFLRDANAIKPLRLTVVDVRDIRPRRAIKQGEIVLWNEWGVEIKWGMPEVHDTYVTGVSDWRKLESLYSVVRAEGANVKNLEYIDVRWDSPLARYKDGAKGVSFSKRRGR